VGGAELAGTRVYRHHHLDSTRWEHVPYRDDDIVVTTPWPRLRLPPRTPSSTGWQASPEQTLSKVDLWMAGHVWPT